MHELLMAAQDAAREAGRVIMTHYGNASHDLKSDNSPVTAADKGAHDAIVAILETTGIPILSEEAETVVPPYPTRMWIIDPLDGTKDFIAGTDDFAVMIALIEDGRPVVSVVYAPTRDVLFYAIKGAGAFMLRGTETTPAPLIVSDRTVPELHYLPSVHHYTPLMKAAAARLQVAKVMHRGSVGIKAALICEGIGDFFFILAPVGEWDVCAPELILTEAGGTVTDRHGDPLFYGESNNRITKGAVFSNSASHAQILETLDTLIAEGVHLVPYP